MIYNLKKPEWTNLINIHYGACLGVVFAVTISVASTVDDVGNIRFLIANGRWGMFVPMTIYFLLDWMAINIRRETVEMGLTRIFFIVGWVWFLGFCVLASKSSNDGDLVYLGIYATVTGGYHFYSYLTRHYIPYGNDAMKLFAMLFSSITTIFGLVILWTGSIHHFGHLNSSSNSQIVIIVIWLVVFLKFLEFATFVQATETKEVGLS